MPEELDSGYNSVPRETPNAFGGDYRYAPIPQYGVSRPYTPSMFASDPGAYTDPATGRTVAPALTPVMGVPFRGNVASTAPWSYINFGGGARRPVMPALRPAPVPQMGAARPAQGRAMTIEDLLPWFMGAAATAGGGAGATRAPVGTLDPDYINRLLAMRARALGMNAPSRE